VTPRNCARTWLDTFAETNRYYSSNHQLLGLRVITWNDYEEGTAIEPGIDNCVSLSATLDGNNLNWSVAGGSEDTISFYKIFVTKDGKNLTELASVPAKSHKFELESAHLAPGNYTLYVKAAGKPSIMNHMSNPVAYIVSPR
jgi:hypothetical protein